ncbi:MAG: hypothetical protein ACP5IB_07970 [Thermoplasmata archaeon]
MIERIKAFQLLESLENVEKYRAFYNTYAIALPNKLKNFIKNFVSFEEKLEIIRTSIAHNLTPDLASVLDLLSSMKVLMNDCKEFVEKYVKDKGVAETRKFDQYLSEISEHIRYLVVTKKRYEERLARIITVAGEIEALIRSRLDDFIIKYVINYDKYFESMLEDFSLSLVRATIPPRTLEERLEEMRKKEEMKRYEEGFEEE